METRTVLKGRWTVHGESRKWIIIPGNYSDKKPLWNSLHLPDMAVKNRFGTGPRVFRDRGNAIQWIITQERRAVGNSGSQGIGLW